jgi:hypothetical protein
MNKTVGLILGALGVLGGSFCFGQTYRCDWSVNGIGGGEMTGAYKCGSTVGQTAAGFITGPVYWGLIGYWLPEGHVGIQEQSQRPSGQGLTTHLYSPLPTLFRAATTIRYSLAADGLVSLAVSDITGRVVRLLCKSSVKRGAYSVVWNGTDDRGRELARGVYFCRFSAGGYRQTEKLVLQR